MVLAIYEIDVPKGISLHHVLAAGGCLVSSRSSDSVVPQIQRKLTTYETKCEAYAQMLSATVLLLAPGQPVR